MRTRLQQRTAEILAAPRPAPDPVEREREKAVVHECRYLMRLLADRRRSRGEMESRLRDREVPGAIAHEALSRIDRAGLIDDDAFAAAWVDQRRELRSLADDALRRELRDRHVAEDVIDRALARGENSEEQRCRQLLRERLRSERSALAAAQDSATRARLARRLDGYLRRRGYPAPLVGRVVSGELLAATGR